MNRVNYSFTEIKNIYHNEYLFNIYQLLLNTHYEYEFISISDLILANENAGILKPFREDLFLESFKENKILLAEDIIKFGTYWPLITTSQKEVVEGSHRLYSLSLYNNFVSKVPNKFLCIKMPWNINEYHNTNFLLSANDLKTPIPFYYLNEETFLLEKKETSSSYLIHQNCFKISSILLNNPIFLINKRYKNFILPNKILNNEGLFKKFLSEDFKEGI